VSGGIVQRPVRETQAVPHRTGVRQGRARPRFVIPFTVRRRPGLQTLLGQNSV
jgi:hypothetical protein